MTGQQVSHYRIAGRLGGGAMGVVYAAEDLRLGRRVAIKFLSEEACCEPEAVQRFLREAGPSRHSITRTSARSMTSASTRCPARTRPNTTW
jgi:serine/threonine protein kinase